MSNPNPGDSDRIALSAAGARRRERMIAELQREMGRVHTRRRTVWFGATVCLALACLGVAATIVRRPRTPTSGGIAAPMAGTSRPERTSNPDPALVNSGLAPRDQPAPARSHIEIVDSKPERYAHIEVIDDDALLRALDRAGRPSGLVRTGGRVVLTRNVVDPVSG